MISNSKSLGPGEESKAIYRIAIYTMLLLSAAYVLIPYIVMMLTSVKTMDDIRTGTLIAWPREFTSEAWREAWGEACIGVQCGGVKLYFWNSIKLVIPAVLVSTLLGAVNGYALTHWKFKGSDTFFAMLLLGCFIPFQVVILPMARVLGMMGIANTATGLILVHIIYGLSFTTLFFRNFYVTIPDMLVKAAKIDGAGFFRIFWKIMLPVSPPIFMVCVIWQTTQIWNDFLFGVIFSAGDQQPITVALNNLVNTSSSVKKYNVDMAAAIIAGLPTLLIYVFAGKYFVRGLTAGSVKG